MEISWSSCPIAPIPWINLRETLLMVLGEPAFLLPLLFLLTAVGLCFSSLSRSAALLCSLAVSLSASFLYSPLATSALEHWLTRQLPNVSTETSRSPATPTIGVLLGRGPDIAAVTTTAAVAAFQRRDIRAFYVSGDHRSEVGAFYWTVPAPDIVNLGREEQGSGSV